jgi:hypothetical protein
MDPVRRILCAIIGVSEQHYLTRASLMFGGMLLALSLHAQPPTLGVYNDTMVIAGANVILTPSAIPTNTTSAVAFTNTTFTGILSVDPATGVVTVINAFQTGTDTVTVQAFGAGGTATQTFVVTVTDPFSDCLDGQFSNLPNVSTDTGPNSIALGDFNGDGNQDIATASNKSVGTVSIRLGDGAGAFTGSTNVAVGSLPKSVAICDFNGDGNQDIAAASSSTNAVSIRLGDGSGGFTGSTEVSVGDRPFSVAVGDFNGDGKKDFATANFDEDSVSIRLGDGLGGFSGSTSVYAGSNSAPRYVAVGDFNEDGNQDLATANTTADEVAIFIGAGTGGFSAPTIFPVG